MDKEEDTKRENAIQALRSFNYKKSTIDDFKDIFEYDVSVETKDEYDETPLVKAVYAQNKEIVEYLLSKNADMYATNLSGETTMMICAKNGFLDIAEILLKKGYDLNKSIPSTRQSVLSLATWANQSKMVSWLLDNNANVNIADDQWWTPLMVASYSGFTNIVKELLKHDANTVVKNKKGLTAFDLATLNNHSDIIELLNS